MLKRFFFSLLIALLITGVGLIFILRVAHNLQADREAAAARLRRPDISVTIIEGKRREEIAAQLATAGICSYQDFLDASKASEGYLFPDTYRFFTNTPASQVVAEMKQDFQNRVGDLKPTADQLILASIIEREAKDDLDRPLIAGVYTNRIAAGMRLEADPTVQYSKDSLLYNQNPSASFVFWHDITQYDYQNTDYSYNTYLNAGLPPGPIANPGRSSILAAIHPAQHSYYYFLYRNGQLLLSHTLQEQLSKE